MKSFNIKYSIGLLILSTPLLCGCIREVFPSDVATTTQLAQSPDATEFLVSAIPTKAKSIYNDHVSYSWGLGGIMHIRDVMTEDLATLSNRNWDWFWWWSECTDIGAPWMCTQYVWEWNYQYVQATNNVINGVNPESATDMQKAYLGVAYANRAMIYLDMARMYEFLPNKVTSGRNEAGIDVTNLTVPIVKAGMKQDDARQNPRATREEMAKFIASDLDEAAKYLPLLTDTRNKTFPDMACIEGLRARLAMWLEDYPAAEKHARLAINAARINPMTKDDCLNVANGFNRIEKWMWGVQYTDQDDAVSDEWLNWTSWMCNETQYGYARKGAFQLIGKRVYDRIANTDFRKLQWKAPDGSPLADQVPFLKPAYKQSLPAYASLKFRPNQGNDEAFKIGEASAFPIMRVEEMYFIEAEAAAHQDPARGKQLVENFMKQHRDPSYVCNATAKDAIVEEIVFQKRIELWGEGQTFFDVKRLNYSVTRGYEGTNFEPTERINTDGRPAWMNFVIVDQEVMSNPILNDHNNPDPSGLYKPWTGH